MTNNPYLFAFCVQTLNQRVYEQYVLIFKINIDYGSWYYNKFGSKKVSDLNMQT